MESVLHIILLSTLTVCAMQYAINPTVIHAALRVIGNTLWQEVIKIAEFVFTGCCVIFTVVLIVIIVKLLTYVPSETPTKLTKKVSETVLRSCGLVPSSKESKVFEKITPVPNKYHKEKTQEKKTLFYVIEGDD